MAGKPGMRDKLFKSPQMVEKFRSSIRVGLIRNRLMKHITGELEMTPTQIQAAKILLDKSVPNLAHMEHAGSVEHRYVALLPEPAENAEQWQKQHSQVATLQ